MASLAAKQLALIEKKIKQEPWTSHLVVSAASGAATGLGFPASAPASAPAGAGAARMVESIFRMPRQLPGTKVKLLLALLDEYVGSVWGTPDTAEAAEDRATLRRVLVLAGEDKDEWVRVTAGMVGQWLDLSVRRDRAHTRQASTREPEEGREVGVDVEAADGTRAGAGESKGHDRAADGAGGGNNSNGGEGEAEAEAEAEDEDVHKQFDKLDKYVRWVADDIAVEILRQQDARVSYSGTTIYYQPRELPFLHAYAQPSPLFYRNRHFEPHLTQWTARINQATQLPQVR